MGSRDSKFSRFPVKIHTEGILGTTRLKREFLGGIQGTSHFSMGLCWDSFLCIANVVLVILAKQGKLEHSEVSLNSVIELHSSDARKALDARFNMSSTVYTLWIPQTPQCVVCPLLATHKGTHMPPKVQNTLHLSSVMEL